MIKIGICDSDETEAKDIKNQILKWFPREGNDGIQIYYLNEVLFDIEDEVFDADIMIIDIDISTAQIDAVSLVAKINDMQPRCQIIYISSHIESVLNIYETEHCYFILKSDWRDRLKPALLKADRIFGQLIEQRRLEVISERRRIFINMRRILFVERIGRQIHIITFDKEYVSYQSLKQLRTQMGNNMLVCHSGYIVNLDYITDVQNKYIEVAAKYQIPLGRTYATELKRRYQELQLHPEESILYQFWKRG